MAPNNVPETRTNLGRPLCSRIWLKTAALNRLIPGKVTSLYSEDASSRLAILELTAESGLVGVSIIEKGSVSGSSVPKSSLVSKPGLSESPGNLIRGIGDGVTEALQNSGKGVIGSPDFNGDVTGETLNSESSNSDIYRAAFVR